MMADQDLDSLLRALIGAFPTANKLQAWLIGEVWPAYRRIEADKYAAAQEERRLEREFNSKARASAKIIPWVRTADGGPMTYFERDRLSVDEEFWIMRDKDNPDGLWHRMRVMMVNRKKAFVYWRGSKGAERPPWENN
jgi:hypothetical protein